MKTTEMWKKSDPWSWLQMLALLALEFVFVICVIKYPLQQLYVDWMQNTLYAGTLTGLTIAITLMLGIYIIALRPQKLTWAEVGVKPFAAKDWWRILLWILALIILSLATVYLTSFLGTTVENSKTESLKQHVTLFTLLLGVVSAGIISPVYEEIFYRGFIYRWLRTRVGMGGAILISALIFTAAHYPTTNAMPVNFVGGVLFAWAYERTGSVWPGILVHGITNTIGVLLTVVG
ncbi:CAAX protease [Paenibacillus sp. KS1]|uniref:CPBP family intramembrane glutamic endopeptidase n=1 Tax=Paenibacillus sp. KS1 TaxID=1849249 RepID=UPI0008065BB8|nr:type II CAAX endopeptidase family protein [Paenibacillus sp. KS1]OBY79476.1 CAAX protease [Paenibacillus sp. KS1]